MRLVVQRMKNSLSLDWKMLLDLEAKSMLQSYFQGKTHSILYTINGIPFIFSSNNQDL